MDERDLQLEALKALREWSTWLVTVQTAVVTAIVSGFIGHGSQNQMCFIKLTVSAFAGSVLAGAWLIGAIPATMQKVTNDMPKRTIPFLKMEVVGIYAYDQFSIPLWLFAFVEHLLFIVGVICFVIAAWI